jgi:hypothetical protein
VSDGSLSLASFAFIISLDGVGPTLGSCRKEKPRKRGFQFPLKPWEQSKGMVCPNCTNVDDKRV